MNPINYGSGRILPGHFEKGGKSLNIIKYSTFVWNIFESLINSNDPEQEPDSDPGGHLITDPPDPDPQHWESLDHLSLTFYR